MIWLTWRQNRLELLIAGGALAAFAALMILNGMAMSSAYHSNGLPACIGHEVNNDNCQRIEETFRNNFGRLAGLIDWFNFLPLLVGILLAAPIIMELEKGTYRLAWTQGITRSRWAGVKLTVITSWAAIAGIVIIGVMTWWFSPLTHLNSRLEASYFDFQGIVPVAYTIYALSLCVATGTLMRKTVPAIGLSIIGFLVVRLPLEGLVRRHYLAPITHKFSTIVPFFQNNQDWQLGGGMIRHGQVLSDAAVNNYIQICSSTAGQVKGFKGSPGQFNVLQHCLSNHGLVQFVTFQPANRFWTFQAIETGIFLGISAVLLTITMLWIKFRVN